MNRQRPRSAPASYHTARGDFRNIAVPKSVHRRLSHIAIDHDLSVSEIVTKLCEAFCDVNQHREEVEGLMFTDLRTPQDREKELEGVQS